MGKVTYDFRGERYVVTGASSGIGRQICEDLVRHGATVLALGRDKGRLEQLRQKKMESIFAVSLDINDFSVLEDSIEEFVQSRGKIHGGVHAAGITGITPLRTYERSEVRQIMDTSFWAGIEFLRLITKSKYACQGTSNVLFSSVCAQSHEKGMFAYAAAKAAIDAAIGSIAKEICSKGHRVNSVLPGWIDTPMTESMNMGGGREIAQTRGLLGNGFPSDISQVVLFLLSDASRWITGTHIPVDGGYLA